MFKRIATALTAILALSGGAAAQDAASYPSKPVTIIVPFSPGGSTDLLGRSLANVLQEQWGQPVLIENRPGAGSMIGVAHLAQQKPDGYTLLLNTAAQTTAPAIQKTLPFDPEKDVTPIMMVATSPYTVVASKQVKADNLKDFIAEAKEKPMFFATAGVGSSSHFTAELLIQQADLPGDVVHFTGGGDAQTNLMGGHADIYISTTASVMPYVNDGSVKALGVLGPDRFKLLPDVQSSGEIGIEGIDINGWVGLMGPGGMDKALVQKIYEDVGKAMQSEAFQKVLDINFVVAGDTTPEEFQKQNIEEMKLWKDLAEKREIVAQ